MAFKQTVQRRGFQLGYAAIFLLLVAPLLVIIASSFTPSTLFTLPPEAVTLEWYLEFLRDPAWAGAVKNSLIVGVGTTTIATTLSVLAAFGLHTSESDWLERFVPVMLVPLFLPPVVLGVALLAFLGSYNLHQTYFSIIVAHSLWATPISFLIFQAVMTQVNWGLRDAALDLGATPSRTFIEIVLPQIKEGLFAAGLIAFIISLQEFIMALFLSGHDTRTIPVLAWTSISQSLDPIVNVVSTLLIFVVVLGLGLAALSIGLNRLAKQL